MKQLKIIVNQYNQIKIIYMQFIIEEYVMNVLVNIKMQLQILLQLLNYKMEQVQMHILIEDVVMISKIYIYIYNSIG